MRTAVTILLVAVLGLPRPVGSQEPQGRPSNPQDQAKQESPAEPREKSLFQTGLLGVGMEHRLYYKTQLLTMPEVLDELDLSPSQREKLKAAQAEHKKEIARLDEIVAKGNAQADAAARRAFRQQSAPYAATLTRADEWILLKPLTIAQQKRLEQIQLQADGYHAFQLPDFLDKFDFLEGQLQQFKQLFAQARTSVAAAASTDNQLITGLDKLGGAEKTKMLESEAFSRSVNSVRRKVRAAREAALNKYLDVMDSNQRTKYKILLGKPFTFPDTTNGTITKTGTGPYESAGSRPGAAPRPD